MGINAPKLSEIGESYCWV
jgi:hypothetical protein